jgi:large subunit ribosomal protein L10
MNRDQKAATIEQLAAEIEQSQAVFAVDYRGITVPQAAELRGKLREAEATFRIVKNSLTERAADQVGAESLKQLLSGPTALTFVRGDAALAAKALADYAKAIQLLPFKGGMMEGKALDAAQITAISKLPSREVLYGQLVGVVASPVTGLVRTMGALLGGLAVALGQVREKKESGEIPAGEGPPVADETQAAAETPAPQETDAEQEPAAEAEQDATPAADGEPVAEGEPVADEEPVAEAESVADEEPAAEAESVAEGEPTEALQDQAEESAEEPARDDNQADASAQDDADTAEATKED